MKIIEGNILDATEQYIAHVCNCVSRDSAGLAKAIFDKYPQANSYQTRTKPSELGTIEVIDSVINMYSMYYPGSPRRSLIINDDAPTREKYFQQCLNKILEIPDLKSVAFPVGIGCGLGGGNWKRYLAMLQEFDDKNICIVTLYQYKK